jgi:hypothetical protein
LRAAGADCAAGAGGGALPEPQAITIADTVNGASSRVND